MGNFYPSSDAILLQSGDPLLLQDGNVMINERGIRVPIYLTPQFINYDMIKRYLAVGQVKVVFDEDVDYGIYIGEVNDLMAQAETYIIQTILSNYVQPTLETVTGEAFETLLFEPLYQNTYIQIRNTFIAQALCYIYKNYFAIGGEGNNGAQLIEQQQQIVNNFGAMAMRIDQSGNLQYKNIFNGLKRCPNGSNRIAKGIRQPKGMFNGSDRANNALETIPNYRWNY